MVSISRKTCGCCFPNLSATSRLLTRTTPSSVPCAVVQVFDHVRVIDRDGEPWWVLADVCRVLELTNPSMVAKSLEDDERGTLNNLEGGPDRIIISEPGLYKLIQTSRKPVL